MDPVIVCHMNLTERSSIYFIAYVSFPSSRARDLLLPARRTASTRALVRHVLAASLVVASLASDPLGAQQRAAAQSRPELVYHNYCSVCHGDRGDGRSRARASLVPPPRDFTQAAQLERVAMIAVVRDGKPGTAMVGWKTQLNDADIAAVVDYIRATFMPGGARAGGPSPAVSGTSAHGGRQQDAVAHQADMSAPMPGTLRGDAQRGRGFYAANCATCHGIRGDGQGPRAYFINPRPRKFLDPGSRTSLNRPALFAAIAMGRTGSEMPAWSKVIDERAIADVAEYVFVEFIRPAAGDRPR